MYQSARTALALLAAAAMALGLAQPALAAEPSHFHFVRGSATTTPGSVCVDSYVEPAWGVAAVTLDIALNGAVRDSVTSKLTTSKRGSFADSIKYHRCFDIAAGPVAVTAVATANPDSAAGRPVTVAVLDQLLQVAAVRPPTVPAAPGKPSVRATGATSIKVAWGQADDGGSRVTGYEVRVSKGSTVRTVHTTGTSVTVPGLKLHSAYSVTVRARNSVGSSAASPAAGIRLEPPGRPAKPAASAGSATSARLVWTAPKSAGGPPVTGYQIRVLHGSTLVRTVAVAADKRSVTLAGLEGATRYSVDVRAKNAVGYSMRSSKASFTTKGWTGAAKWAAKKYGTFSTVTIRGTGNDLIELPRGAKAGLLSAQHSGAAGFSVKVQDSTRNTTDWPVNTIGAYAGTTVFGMDSWRGTPRHLEIRTSGDWTIRISAVRTAASLPGTGRGDGVYLYDGGTSRLAVTHNGHRNFVVYTYAGGLYGRDHVVNAYGAFRGTAPFKKGPAVVEVLADGSWTTRLG
ncbi:fibronectin type III domain-containing protein [Lysobacter korlensis]|uniref:Fibronectin type III domain-containing protein n=1 Tax=Lysobacter korlensis TaxID=553636 RepID=A0ABV6RPY8_9GAMM